MKIRDIITEADVSDLGKMDPKMADILGKVRDQDIEDRAKADAERAAKGKAKLDKIMALAKKHGYDLDPASSGYFMTGVNDGKRGYRDRGAGDAYGPHVGAYDRGVDIGMKIADQDLDENIDLKHRLKPGTYKHREENITVEINPDKTVSFKQPAQWEIESDQEYLEYAEGLLADPKGWHSVASESATVGGMSANNVADIANPHLSPGSARGKKSYLGKPGSHGGTKAPPQPKVKQPKKRDGTAVNALDMGTSLFGKGAVKR